MSNVVSTNFPWGAVFVASVVWKATTSHRVCFVCVVFTLAVSCFMSTGQKWRLTTRGCRHRIKMSNAVSTNFPGVAVFVASAGKAINFHRDCLIYVVVTIAVSCCMFTGKKWRLTARGCRPRIRMYGWYQRLFTGYNIVITVSVWVVVKFTVGAVNTVFLVSKIYLFPLGFTGSEGRDML